jgi:glutamyl-tRNA reductase
MPLVVVGLNHTTASVDIRERFAFAPDQQQPALRDIAQLPSVSEAALLSTCNRTEIYAATHSQDGGPIIEWMHHWHQLDAQIYTERFYHRCGHEAVRHLLHVSGGLDSLVLGEPQIGGQVKQAWDLAKGTGTLGPMLDRWFQRAFHTVKRIRAETAIGRDPVTVPYAAVALAKQIFGDLPQRSALLVGAGEMMTLCANYLHAQGIQRINVANRSLKNAQALAAQYQGEAMTLDQLPEALAQADLVITSTASQVALIDKAMVKAALRKRRHEPMLLVDIAVPRDIAPEVADLSDVFLYTIDDLQEVIRNSLDQRQRAALDAQEIVRHETDQFLGWLEQRRANEVMQDYRRHAASIRDNSLAQAQRMLAAGNDPEEVLQQFANQLTNRLLHHPSRGLQNLAAEGQHELVQAFSRLLMDSQEHKKG